MSRDTWEGSYNNPITFGKWIYANSNPITYSDPTGYFAIVKYDRGAAVAYAKKYAVNYNPEYWHFDSDCTNFVSQALHAGGMKMEMDWTFSRGRGLAYGHAWTVADDLFGYLVGNKGFSYSIISGTIPPAENPDAENEDDKKSGRYGAYAYPSSKVIPNPLQMENYGGFDFRSYGIQKGDVVLYHQLHSDYVKQPDENGKVGLFNHAAFVIDNDSRLTDRANGKTYSFRAPRIAEHSGGYENTYGASWEYNTHSINDTWTEVQSLIVIHIPDTIIYSDDCP